jgi:hypothetical protein
MSDTTTRPADNDDVTSQGSWLQAEMDGRPVRFWILVGVVIAEIVVGFGAWWVWGLDRGVQIADGTAGQMNGGMAGMPVTDVRLPPVAGFYDGQGIFFVHPEASDPDVAGMLTDMMGGSPVLVVPELADVPAQARDTVFVFTNGIEGTGPFGFQPDVFPSAPGDGSYRPLRRVVLVAWIDQNQARELRSADEITTAEDAGEIDLEETDIVVNMPLLTWPGGQR